MKTWPDESPGPMNRVWIDTDCGFDDMAAIAMVAADPAWRIEGLGLVAGNAPLSVVIDNAVRMSAFFGWTLRSMQGGTAR